MTKSSTNETIAKFFLEDSSDFLKRYRILREESIAGNMGMRSKLLVDLLFSAECSIKALIFLESEEDANTIYNKIFKHELNQLLKNFSAEKQNNLKQFLDDEKFMKYSISNRYMLETYKKFKPDGTFSEEYYDTIVNYVWLDAIYKKLDDLRNFVWSKIASPIESFTFGENIDDISKQHAEIMNLKKETKKKE